MNMQFPVDGWTVVETASEKVVARAFETPDIAEEVVSFLKGHGAVHSALAPDANGAVCVLAPYDEFNTFRYLFLPVVPLQQAA
jgi:hypothetical protein